MHVARIALIAALAFAPAAFADDTPSAMLEKGIFQEETAGNLDAAIKFYKQIVDEANAGRHAIAEAQYRLGVCYQKQGKKGEAQAAFRDLVSKYADEKDLVAKAEKELGVAAPALTASYEPLELDPAPWPDDELMVMSIKSKADVELGAIFYTAKRLDSHGQPVIPTLPPTALSDTERNGGEWRIESYQVIPMNDWRQYTRVDADAMTFAPMTGRTKNGMGDFRADYQPGKIALEVTRDGKPTTRDIPAEGTVYDNEQVIYLLRRLPLKEGYTARFPIFPVMGGAVVECRIRVEGREGTQEHPCWKVVLSVLNQGVETLQQQLWIEAGGSRSLVKYDSGSAILELTGVRPTYNGDAPGPFIGHANPTSEERYKIADGLRISLPPGWFGCRDHLMPQYIFSVQLLPPELKAWAVFIGQQRPADEMTARKIAEVDAAKLKGVFKNYAVRADSWSDVTISGLKGVSFVADYQDNARAMVEYRTYILTPRLVVWFVFRVDKDQFDANRPEFDKMVQGLKAPEWMSGPDAEYLTLCLQAILEAAALPPEVHAENIEWYRRDEPQIGWQLTLTLSSDNPEQLQNIYRKGYTVIRKATLFPEKISFVGSAGIGGTGLVVNVISREEAEKRRAAAQHETENGADASVQFNIAAAKVTTEYWLSIVDARKYAFCWEQCVAPLTWRTGLLQGPTGPQDLEAALKKARAPFGKLVSRKLLSADYKGTVPGATVGGKYVVMQYKTDFENKKAAVETIRTMRDMDGQMRVSGYTIK